MDIKCKFCGEAFDSHLQECPHCGAPNENFEKEGKASIDSPSTIKELKEWYRNQNFPPLNKIDFHIGNNNTNLGHSGIYKNQTDGKYIVYEITHEGKRNVFYRGSDETSAVEEACRLISDKVNTYREQKGSNDKVKCPHCGKLIDASLMVCPYCGGPNEKAERSANSEPQTIEELKSWYSLNKLPPEKVTRFFIGKDIKEKQAFGIYKDKNSGDFVVYKNKSDGSRAVRYKGKDEAYAVNEIYQRLREEIINQKKRNKDIKGNTNYSSKKKDEPGLLSELAHIFFSDVYGITALLLILALSAGIFYCVYWIFTSPSSGYYNYNNQNYYHDVAESKWYVYDDKENDWIYTTDIDDELFNNYDDYIDSYSYSSNKPYSDISDDSDYQKDHVSSSSSNSSSSSSWDDDDDDDWGSSWDNDSSWDSSDSWDSGSTDWDSDW